MKKVLVYLSALPMLALAPLASALTCDEVTITSAITSQFPTAQEACLAVVERDGRPYIHMKAELTRDPRGNTATFRFMHADGTYGPTYSAELDPSWRAQISGRSYRLRDLSRGQELDVYLPPDRFAVHVHADDAPVEAIAPVAVMAAAPEPEPEPMLPATASKMPLFALFGALALLGAGMLRIARRQSA